MFCSRIKKKKKHLKLLWLKNTKEKEKFLKFHHSVLKLTIVRTDNWIISIFSAVFLLFWPSVIKVYNSQFSISFVLGEKQWHRWKQATDNTKMIYCHSPLSLSPQPPASSKAGNQLPQPPAPEVWCPKGTVGHTDNLLKGNGFDYNLALINYSVQF